MPHFITPCMAMGQGEVVAGVQTGLENYFRKLCFS